MMPKSLRFIFIRLRFIICFKNTLDSHYLWRMEATCAGTKGAALRLFDRAPLDEGGEGQDSIDPNCCLFDKQRDTVSKENNRA